MGQLVNSGSQLPVADTGRDQQQYLTFNLGGEVFAMGILAIKEIIEYGNLTEVPMMPGFIRGVINLRGAVVPVVDLSVRFGRAGTNITRRTCIVIIEIEAEGESQDVGVIVDAVNEVLEILDQDIEPAPAFGAKIRTDFIKGMGKVASKFVIILNVNRVLSVDEMAALAGVPDGENVVEQMRA
ncbi:chemotaxis protein CheW [Sulfurimicrobium lacus]|uniref:Chemotaxis protein CheW n=1 Tax=Sulfurimicrobium lacus TaxID=2715678 RepID=A0A6F8VG11_9PROT|nr:chemotaxis protein CheW [Sulfurimicrobium lacus]BCB28658.1 chemotaxis protein CheW [Sulfurimicrobium lacus]